MATYRSPRQPDLFEKLEEAGGRTAGDDPADDEYEAEVVARIRNELLTTLALVRNATEWPWKLGTDGIAARWRFNAILHWLPAAEAEELRESFQREYERVWAIDAEEAAAVEAAEEAEYAARRARG